MQTIKFSLFVLVVVARLCQAEVVIASPTPDRSTSRLVEYLVTIVTSCYGDRIHGGIGLAGDLPDTLLKRLSTQHSIPVALIDYPSKNEPYWVPLSHRRKMQIFIVGASSAEQLYNIIQLRVKQSMWWNHMASFLILDRSSGCRRFGRMLNETWNELEILNAKVMCYKDKLGMIVVTHNPFTSLAPVPWRKFAVVKGNYNHPFTALFSLFRENETICVNFDFDKVKDCGGYPIPVNGISFRDIAQEVGNGYKYGRRFALMHGRILFLIFRTLNANPRYNRRETTQSEFDTIWIHDSWRTYLVSNTYMHEGMILITKFRGNKSQLQKILGVIDTNSHIGLGIVYLVTLIFFKFVVNQALVPAILNLIRITCGMGFENIPHSHPPRIYLTGILFFAVTMHGIFEGNLASLLTTVIPLRNINTLQDVLNYNYTIYGYDNLTYMMLPEEFKERLVPVHPVSKCFTKVTNEKSAACLGDARGTTIDFVKKFNLHTSPEVVKAYTAFTIRWNWPYEERFNILLSRLVEADILEPWYDKCDPVNLEDFQTDQDVKQNKAFKNIELGELEFAFVILGIGLVLASITFVVELGIHYKFSCVCRIEIERLQI